MAMRFRTIYRLNVALTKLRPRIWRRVELPGNASFWDLHVAIQDVMDWPDAYRHFFEIERSFEKGGPIVLGGGSPEDLESGEFHLPEVAVPLSRFLAQAGDVAYYAYRFKQPWWVKIVLEAIVPRERGVRYPRCVKGARASPPPDCGGPFAYGQLVGMLEDPEGPDHAYALEQLGSSFDPRAFDPRSVRFLDPRKCWWAWFALPSADET